MSYVNKVGLGYLIPASNAFDTAENLLAAAAVHGEYYVTKPCAVSGFRFIVTSTIGIAGAPVVEINKRPTPGSSSSEVLIDQITIPVSTAAGKVLVTRFAPVQLDVGDSLSFEHVTSTTTGGAGFYDVEIEVDEEADGNQTDLIVSA